MGKTFSCYMCQKLVANPKLFKNTEDTKANN